MCNKYKWHVRLVKTSAAVYLKKSNLPAINSLGSLNLKYVQQSLTSCGVGHNKPRPLLPPI